MPESRTYQIAVCALCLAAALPLGAQVKFQDEAEKSRVAITVEGKAFSNLYYGPEWPLPFLHPLRAASGVAVTRGYPVEQIEGEIQDHKWHHGLWFGHGDVNGVDFWRDLGAEKTGRMVVKGKPSWKKGKLTVEAELVTPKKEALGTVAEEFQFAAQGALRMVDAVVTVRADKGLALKMGDTEEGTFAVRLADEFREGRGVTMKNAAGDEGKVIWGKRAKWVDYSTTVKGEKAGVIVLEHPSNPKHPTYWHARPYGLLSANPFGEHDFLKDKTRDGSMTVPAGGKLELRYRVVIHPGGLGEIDAEKLFTDYAGRK
ncbi:MAG: PmoA family protein [Acidobacteria bacterium]|nr:PmoA family protein [Acidobacteriota bacterium]